MIIARSPLRITLGGGGTDLPSYYREHGGFLIAGAIDKHVYVSMQHTFRVNTLIRYSQIEEVSSVHEIKHPIIREALRILEIHDRNIEITTMADVPAGTGLGSSGSFGTALLKALHRFRNRVIDPHGLAEMASRIEIDILREPVGKQDTYAAACGGLNCYEFRSDDTVRVTPLKITAETMGRLQDHVVMFCTFLTRSASAILKEQDDKTRSGQRGMLDSLHYVKEIGLRSRDALERGDVEAWGRLLQEHWLYKKMRSASMSAPEIDRWYRLAMENGALGGKLVGAGGGGFLMFYAEDPLRLARVLGDEGLLQMKFQFDFEGTSLRE
jgi:D-glycero-alpha-D-manno-heptose-7-phosphate kinase